MSSATTTPLTTHIRPSLMIASLGNPSPHFNTLHSAGHHLLARLAFIFSAASASPPPTPKIHFVRRGGFSHTHHPDDQNAGWSFWESPVQMNVSGRAVKKAWAAFSAMVEGLVINIDKEGGVTMSAPERKKRRKRLVLLHDEMEAPLGKVRFRGGLEGDCYDYGDGIGKSKGASGGSGNGNGNGILASAKGHNGVKSVLDAFRAHGKGKNHSSDGLQEEISRESIIRVGVGIGRPASRDPGDVSEYVLKTMTERERGLVEGTAEQVVERLQALRVPAPTDEGAEE